MPYFTTEERAIILSMIASREGFHESMRRAMAKVPSDQKDDPNVVNFIQQIEEEARAIANLKAKI